MANTTDGELDEQSRRLLDELRELRALEERKRETARSSGEFHDLADEVVLKADEVYRVATVERDLADEDSPDPHEREEQEPGDWTS